MRGRAGFLGTWAFCVGALLTTAPAARGQTPTLETRVDTTVVTVGDPITLTVTVDHPPGSRVQWPDSLAVGSFDILGARTTGPEERDGLARSTLVVTLAAFELGELELPGFQVAVVSQEGDTTLLDTNPYGIRVESVGLDESGDIRELKGPLGIPLSLGRIALWTLAVLLALTAAWVIFRRMRRRERDDFQGSGPAAPYRPPHEVALEALDALEASPLLERGEVKEFHVRLSDILRGYLEGRFRIPALEMTTGEILRGLEGMGVGSPLRERFRTLLDRCDMVKFAKHRPTAEASQKLLALGRELVEETMEEATRPAMTVAGGGAGDETRAPVEKEGPP